MTSLDITSQGCKVGLITPKLSLHIVISPPNYHHSYITLKLSPWLHHPQTIIVVISPQTITKVTSPPNHHSCYITPNYHRGYITQTITVFTSPQTIIVVTSTQTITMVTSPSIITTVTSPRTITAVKSPPNHHHSFCSSYIYIWPNGCLHCQQP